MSKMDMETRIDRIERYLVESAQGMLELKESQQKTDAQLKKTIKSSG
jgi:hypothetical protein